MSFRNKPYKSKFDYSNEPRRIYAYLRDAIDQHKKVGISEETFFGLVLLNRSIRNIESSEENHEEYIDLSQREMIEHGTPTTPSAESILLNLLFARQLKEAFWSYYQPKPAVAPLGR